MSQHWYNDAATWRATNALWYNDAGTWREMAQAWYNDAGTWRRVHRRELRRPTARTYTSGGTGTNSETNPTNAYDADDSTHILTFGSWQRSGVPAASRTSTTVFSSWQTTANTYNTLRLYLSASGSGNDGQTGATSSVKFEISVDAGSNWTQMWLFTTPATITGSLAYTLSAAQNLANVQIRMSVQGASGGGTFNVPGDAIADVWDIFTVGTY